MVEFPETTSEHVAVVAYEGLLLEALPRAHHMIHAAELAIDRFDQRRAQDAEDTVGLDSGGLRARLDRRKHEAALEALRSERHALDVRLRSARGSLQVLTDEISRVREWLDSFVNAAEEYAAHRPELRSALAPPSMPASARRYAAIDEFLEENPARRLYDGHPRAGMDADGVDFGHDWTWQSPDTPWTIGQWRVSYIDALRELYAYELEAVRARPFVSFDRSGSEKPRHSVWLLASDFEIVGERRFFESPTWNYLTSLEAKLMHQRNSLILLAEAIAEHQAGVGDSAS